MVKKKKNKGGKKNGAGGFFLGAAIGAVAGAVTGLLTAPKSGKETRADIARGSKKAANKVKAEGKKIVGKMKHGGDKKKKTTKSRK